MEKLKPCPFCGGEAELKKADGNVWIECKKCFCGTAFANGASPTSTLVEIVTNDWNKRAESEELKFTRDFIHEHGLEFALADAWNRRAT